MKISFWFEFAKQFLQEQILSFLNCFFCASEEDLFFFFSSLNWDKSYP